MEYRFDVIKRTFEDKALIVFIDLLGTKNLYESPPTEEQAKKILRALLVELDISFSEYFGKESQDNFDISIFADSIVINVINMRRKLVNIVERLVDFLLDYQQQLLLNCKLASRAIITEDAFFSFKMTRASPESILSSEYTNVSLCGGKGIKFANDKLKGLPIGVYVTDKIRADLSKGQNKRIIKVQDDDLFFIKQAIDDVHFLPDKTIDMLLNRPDATKEDIENSLKAANFDEDALKKWLPWFLVHIGRQDEITRESNKCTSSDRK